MVSRVPEKQSIPSEAPAISSSGGIEVVSRVPETQSAPPGAPKHSSKELFFETWNQFHESRQASNQRLEQTETTLERQKRLAREQQPPTASAKVFRWVKDIDSDGYVREQVSKRWRQDTLGGYSTKQTQYDAFANEWDCSSEFGSDDESQSAADEEFVDDHEENFVDYDRAEKEYSTIPLIASPKPLLNLEDNEQWLPFASQPESLPGQAPTSSSYVDLYEEEIIETAGRYFGYLPHFLLVRRLFYVKVVGRKIF